MTPVGIWIRREFGVKRSQENCIFIHLRIIHQDNNNYCQKDEKTQPFGFITRKFLWIQKIQKEGAEETDDAVLHHSGSICDQTLRRTVKNFLKIQVKKGGGWGRGRGPLGSPLNPSLEFNSRVNIIVMSIEWFTI